MNMYLERRAKKDAHAAIDSCPDVPKKYRLEMHALVDKMEGEDAADVKASGVELWAIQMGWVQGSKT